MHIESIKNMYIIWYHHPFIYHLSSTHISSFGEACKKKKKKKSRENNNEKIETWAIFRRSATQSSSVTPKISVNESQMKATE